MLNNTSNTVQTQARQDGFEARHGGKSQRDCLFDESTELAQEWRCRWIEGWHAQDPATTN